MAEPTTSDERGAEPDSTLQIAGPLAIASVTLGLLTWPIAFNLGAFGEVFYEDVFSVVVASSILFVVVVVNRPYRASVLWPMAVALLSPLLWLVTSALVVSSTSEALDRPFFAVWLALALVVSVPITLILLLDMFTPALETANWRTRLAVVALVAIIGLVGFVVGREHPRFMTCADFRVAGAAEPENCVR